MRSNGTVTSPAGGGATGNRQGFCGGLLPALPEVLGDVTDNRAAQLGGDVVPPEASARLVHAAVPSICRQRGQVDPADEGNVSSTITTFS